MVPKRSRTKIEADGGGAADGASSIPRVLARYDAGAPSPIADVKKTPLNQGVSSY
jgi:hypothetical protein